MGITVQNIHISLITYITLINHLQFLQNAFEQVETVNYYYQRHRFQVTMAYDISAAPTIPKCQSVFDKNLWPSSFLHSNDSLESRNVGEYSQQA